MGQKNLRKFLKEFSTRADDEMSTLTVNQLYKLIDLELAGACRATVVTRLHRRLTTQRMNAERARLAKNSRQWRV